MWRWRREGPALPFCNRCGEEVTLVARPGPIEKVRHFLCYGMPAVATWQCRNGHLTDDAVYGVGRLRASRVPRWVRLPFELVRAIRHSRTMEPVPLTYLGAAGVGAALGVALDRWRGWPWWRVMLGTVGAAWLFFLSSAFHRRNCPHLISQLRYVVDPFRERKRELQDLARRVNAGEIAAYGVADWTGRRRLGGWGASNIEIASLTLAHVLPGEEPKTVDVAVHKDSRAYLEVLREELRERFVLNTPPPEAHREDEESPRRWARQRWAASRSAEAVWETATIPVDGVPTLFELLASPTDFVALAESGDGCLVVEGHGVGPGEVALERVPDVGLYFAAALEDLDRRDPG